MKNKTKLGVGLLSALAIAGIAGCSPLEAKVEETIAPTKPVVAATYTAEPTATAEPTLTPPPLSQMCWSRKAITSFIEQEVLQEYKDIDTEWRESEFNHYNEWWLMYTNKKSDYIVVQFGLLEDKTKSGCIDDLSMTTRLSQDSGYWGLAGDLHGFFNMMVGDSIAYSTFLSNNFNECTHSEKNVSDKLILEGEDYYRGFEFECFYGDSIQLTTRIWNPDLVEEDSFSYESQGK